MRKAVNAKRGVGNIYNAGTFEHNICFLLNIGGINLFA